MRYWTKRQSAWFVTHLTLGLGKFSYLTVIMTTIWRRMWKLSMNVNHDSQTKIRSFIQRISYATAKNIVVNMAGDITIWTLFHTHYNVAAFCLGLLSLTIKPVNQVNRNLCAATDRRKRGLKITIGQKYLEIILQLILYHYLSCIHVKNGNR